MKTLNAKINSAKSLDEVLDLLNSFERDENDEQDRLEHHVDITDLPTFGKAPIDTTEIFSWDETRALIQNTCVGEAFQIVHRTEEFGA
jgi:hypothetical protein